MSTLNKPEVKIPWPRDAVMIIASKRGEEKRVKMEGVIWVSCRHCGEALAADLKSITRGCKIVEGHGRPVDFFCIPCSVKHNRGDIDLFEDHRPGGEK